MRAKDLDALPSVSVGGRVYVDRAALEELIRAQEAAEKARAEPRVGPSEKKG